MKFPRLCKELMCNLKSRVYRKYLVSYLAVFLIPVVVLMGINVMIYRTSLMDSVVQSERDSVGSFQLVYDDILSRANRIVYNISSNSAILRALKARNITLDIEIQAIVDSVLVADDVITDIFIYSNASQRIYGKASSISLHDFLYQESDPVCKELVRSVFVSECTAMQYVKAQNIHMEKGGIVYTVHRQNSDGTWYNVVFVINREYVIQSMNYKGRVGAIVQGNRMVISNSTTETLSAQLADLIQNGPAADGKGYRVGGKKYTAYTEKSAAADITYLMLIPEDTVIQKSAYINWGTLFLLVLWGMVMIVMLANINYSPIRSLNRTTIDVLGAGNEHIDSLQFVNDAIAEIGRQKSDLDRQSDAYAVQLRKLWLMQHIINDEPVEKQKMGIRGSRYRILILGALLHPHSAGGIDGCTAQMENEILKKQDLFLGMCGEQTYMFLLCDDSGEAVDTAAACYRLLCGQNNSCAAGLGMAYSFEKMKFSYNEAVVAAEYSNVLGMMVLYENINHMEDITRYPTADISNIKGLLSRGRIEQANEAIMRTVNEMLQYKQPIFLIKCVCYELVSAMIAEIDKLSVDKDTFMLQPDQIMKIDNLTHLVRVVKNMMYLYQNAYRHAEKMKKTNQMAQVEDYIGAHFCENDFSISHLAEEFGISMANLSKQFKKHKGMNLSQYISEMQMEKAKELLSATDLPISQIANMVGQQDVSNFIRKFKAKEKVTPGEYRKGR